MITAWLHRVRKRREANAKYKQQALLGKQCPFPTKGPCPWKDEAWDFPAFEPTKNYQGPGSAVAPNTCNRCGRQISG